jgi:UDP-N-acetylmuramate dehydrogenase
MTPQSDVALAPFCTMRVGGPARWFVSAQTESDIGRAMAWASGRGVPIHVLGGGSNVVIADEGVDALVIHVVITGVERREDGGRVVFAAGAGEPWDPLVAASVAAGCAGLECLSGIPGCVGGTPVQNVGAYGQDVSMTITHVDAVDRQTASSRRLTNVECGFGYRSSRFKREDIDRFVVTRVEYSLVASGPPTIAYADVVDYMHRAGLGAPTLLDARDAVLAIRRRKGMVIEPGNAANRSCGSFFVNPVVSRDDLRRAQDVASGPRVPHYAVDASSVKIPAAWLIEQAGFPKGTPRGAVGISPFQAQALINRGGARAADLVALACDIKRAVWNMFGISIVPEPVFLGFAANADLRFLVTPQRSH